MNCQNCNNPIQTNYIICPFCTHPINSSERNSNTINAGYNNINIGLGINNEQNISINIMKDDHNSNLVDYQFRYEKPVIGGIEGYNKKYQISGILSLVSALITIGDFIFTKSDLGILFIMFSIGLTMYSLDSKHKYKSLIEKGEVCRNDSPILEYIEEEGLVYKISKFGICPICNGHVHIYKDDKLKKTLGKCQNNSDHLYTYDPTIDKGEPYIIFDIYPK